MKRTVKIEIAVDDQQVTNLFRHRVQPVSDYHVLSILRELAKRVWEDFLVEVDERHDMVSRAERGDEIDRRHRLAQDLELDMERAQADLRDLIDVIDGAVDAVLDHDWDAGAI